MLKLINQKQMSGCKYLDCVELSMTPISVQLLAAETHVNNMQDVVSIQALHHMSNYSTIVTHARV